MRKAVGVIAIAAAVLCVWHLRRNAGPSVEQIEPLLEHYLKSGCRGTLVLERLDSVAVGEFSTRMGGWPIYAAHVETCREGGKSTTYDGSKDAEHKIAAVFARRTAGGGIELYTPEIFQSAQRGMQQTYHAAFDGVQTQ